MNVGLFDADETLTFDLRSVAQSLSRARLLTIPRTIVLQAPLSMDFLGKNTGVGCHTLLRGILDNMSNFWTFGHLTRGTKEWDLWESGAGEGRMKPKSLRTESRAPNPCFPHFGFWLSTCFPYMNVYIINNRICVLSCFWQIRFFATWGLWEQDKRGKESPLCPLRPLERLEPK